METTPKRKTKPDMYSTKSAGGDSVSERFNVVYQQFRAMYDSSCQICCNWSRLKPGFNTTAHPSIMQINMIPHPVTLNCHWANQPCSRP